LINEKEEQVGITTTSEALRMAREAGLDLVEVAPTAKPPVCRIMDYGKWRYQQQKKEDKSRASSRAGQLKELKLKTVKIGENDLKIKIDHARQFLQEGNKVQFTLGFKGREMAHLDLGREIFTKIKAELWLVSKIERDSKMEGRRMTLVLQPDHKAPGSKPPVPGQPAQGGAPRPGGPGTSPMTAGSSLGIAVPGVAKPGVGPAVSPAGVAVSAAPVAASAQTTATAVATAK
jgi:translation initiation factor IF-3